MKCFCGAIHVLEIITPTRSSSMLDLYFNITQITIKWRYLHNLTSSFCLKTWWEKISKGVNVIPTLKADFKC